ncbi:lipoate--protein ligase family protein [Spirulina subsalsa FACHB-351]|uniref:Lipoate--protein ligase family protein n=1 Tax=Spirulina subsalsa FACHB-351 TaxID=234711 RepID=A0ABT3L5T4_9CYAN|nr:lipoate--protein ligase family protein [Spirulina subsalsa]MCW6036853.1 lipoate--protein ligase family protein [Spirulina subsalsa FACHB-351]
MSTRWCWLPPITADGATQMKIDQQLFQAHCTGEQPPTLRFYTWHPVALSLGYHQKHYPHHWSELSWQGRKLDIVRRPTGGRAVLHQGDLTYMVVMSGERKQRQEIYREICEFLRLGWAKLGISLNYGQTGRGYIHNPSCFGTATAADLVTPEGYKLIGSAQLRRGSCVLQHGSMRLSPDALLFEQVFGASEGVGDYPIPYGVEEVITVLREAAQEWFRGDWFTQELS